MGGESECERMSGRDIYVIKTIFSTKKSAEKRFVPRRNNQI